MGEEGKSYGLKRKRKKEIKRILRLPVFGIFIPAMLFPRVWSYHFSLGPNVPMGKIGIETSTSPDGKLSK